jgi:hypothetical protein
MEEIDRIVVDLRRWISGSRQRLDTSTERRFHDTVETALLGVAPDCVREFVASKGNRFDLWVPLSGIVVEVKIKPRLADVVRQIQRYNAMECVRGAILVSATIPPGFPSHLADKPVREVACWPYLLR